MSGTEKLTLAQYRREMGLPPKPGDAVERLKAASIVRNAHREHAEDDLQRVIVQWLRYALRPDVRWTHVPNGGKRGKVEAARLKGLGVQAGWPDLTFAWSDMLNDGHGPLVSRSAFIEVKATGGTLSGPQREFRAWCVAQGMPYAIVKSLDEAVAAVTEWGLVRAADLEEIK